jgi:FMN phosphatase YigB (HAD superfamily)
VLSDAGAAGAAAVPPAAADAGERVFLLDVDNTLLDNDRFCADLGDHLEKVFGAAERARYWRIFGERRERLGLADYLGTLQLFRSGLDDHPELLQVYEYLLDYPFAALVYPQALAAVAHVGSFGRAVALSDGDVVFQPRKIRRSGIWDAVAGRVLIYLHKELVMDHVRQRFPASHYVMVDDKANLLAAMKIALGTQLTTVFVRQGHYALDAQANIHLPPPDRVIERIGDLTTLNLTDFQVRS